MFMGVQRASVGIPIRSILVLILRRGLSIHGGGRVIVVVHPASFSFSSS